MYNKKQSVSNEPLTLEKLELDKELQYIIDYTLHLIKNYRNKNVYLEREKNGDLTLKRKIKNNIIFWVQNLYLTLDEKVKEDARRQVMSTLSNFGAMLYFKEVQPRMSKLAERYYKNKGVQNGSTNCS